MDSRKISVEEGKGRGGKNPNGDILSALQRVVNGLTAHTLPAEKEAMYLRMLIHLVADLYQPLDVGDRDDRGGTSLPYRAQKRCTVAQCVYPST